MISSSIKSIPATVESHTCFSQWIINECDCDLPVLEVGAGPGNARYFSVIRQKVSFLVGIDPDVSINRNAKLDERYQISLEQFADQETQSHRFGCIYGYCVAEHIVQPLLFLTGCHRLLRPGGRLLIYTPNLWHYFGITTKISAKLGLEDWALDRLLGSARKKSYHFPTQYRMNNIGTIERCLESAGFSAVEFRCFDNPAIFQRYLPRLLRWGPTLWSHAVYLLRMPGFMGTLMFKATVR